MQDANGQRPADLTLALLRRPRRFAFFQGVRILSSWQRGSQDGEVPLRVRYRNSLSFGYPVGDIESVRVVCHGEPLDGKAAEVAVVENRATDIEVTQPFTGLLGAFGVLSPSYTERVLDSEDRRGQSAPRCFFDVLIQRPVAQFHAAWRYQHPALGYEIPGVSPLAHALRSLVGDGLVGQRTASESSGGSPDDYAKPLMAALRQRTLSAPYLTRVLSEVTDAPVHVEDHVLAWYSLPEDLRVRIGRANCSLGLGMVLGESTMQRQLRIRLHIGPLRLARYREFLPDGEGTAILRNWLTRLLGHTYEYELAPILHRDDVAGVQLGGPGLSCLGRDAFLVSAPSPEHRSDVRYLLTI
jgi:type VI secretion system protein ImpH